MVMGPQVLDLGILLLILLTFLYFAFVVWLRSRRQRSARYFVALLLSLSEWTASHLLFLIVDPTSVWKLIFANLQYVGISATPGFLLLFLIEHTGAAVESRKTYRKWLFLEPIVYNALVWADPLLHLVRIKTVIVQGGPFRTWSVHYGPAFWGNAAYVYLLALLSFVVLLVRLRRSSFRGRAQGIWIGIGVLSPWIGSVVNLTGLDPTPVDSTFYGFLVTAVTFFVSVGRHRLFRLTARQTVDSILDAMSDIVLVVSADGSIIDANGGAQRMFGRPRSQLQGADLGSFIDGLDELVHTVDGSEVGPHEMMQRELTIHRGEGQAVPMEFVIDRSLDDWGNLTGYVLLGRDLSERKRLEREEQRSRELEATARISGGIAHDFNNILSTISNYAELLERRMTDSGPDRYIPGEILKAVRRGARQVDRLLLFSDGLQFHPDAVRISELIGEVAAMFPRDFGNRLRTEVDEEAGVARVYVDRTLVLEEIRLIINFGLEHAGPNSSTVLRASLEGSGERATAKLEFTLLHLRIDAGGIGDLTRLYARTANAILIGTEFAVADLIAHRHGHRIEIEPVSEKTGREETSLRATTSLGPVLA